MQHSSKAKDVGFERSLKNDLLLRALHRKPVTTTPVWLMRQAGRYLPEYRALREKAGSFMRLCQNPTWAADITLQPLARFNLDAAILFSDILTIPDAMGLGLFFEENKGPAFKNPIKSFADILRLPIPDPEIDLKYVCDTVRLVKKKLNNTVPLIGFCGSPWTVATYMVEGKSNSHFSKIMALMTENPPALHQLLDTLSKAITLHLQAQIKAGADVVMIFDTWGGALSANHYRTYSLCYMERIIKELQKTPTILFTRGSGAYLEWIADTGCTAIGLDETIDINDARHRVGNRVALQGNLSPECVYEPPERLREAVLTVLKNYGPHPGHIFNLGHGVRPDMSPEHIKIIVDTVHQYEWKM